MSDPLAAKLPLVDIGGDSDQVEAVSQFTSFLSNLNVVGTPAKPIAAVKFGRTSNAPAGSMLSPDITIGVQDDGDDDAMVSRYTEAWRTASGYGPSEGHEIAIIDERGGVDTTPYNNSPRGLSGGLVISGGKVGTNAKEGSQLGRFVKVTAGVRRGFVFGWDLIRVINGLAAVLSMAFQQGFEWITPDGKRGPFMRSDVTNASAGFGFIFYDGGIAIQDKTGNNILMLGPDSVSFHGQRFSVAELAKLKQILQTP
jgi:hypothetical protein